MEALAAAAISIVAPYLVKGAEAFAQEAGEQAAGAAKALVGRLRTWWTGEPVAQSVAENLSSDPKKYSPILGGLLASELDKDEALAADVKGLVDDVGPAVTVVQRIEVADGVTGADIEQLVRGSVHVEQEMKHAHDVTGYKGGSIGGA